MICGMMLRECCRHEELVRMILEFDEFYNFFAYVEVSTFDIASDAFSTFKVSPFIQFSLVLVLFLAQLKISVSPS